MKQICPNRIISICFSQIKGPLVLQDRSCQTLTETLGRECLSEYSHTRVTVPPSSFTPVFIDAEKKADSFLRQKTFLKIKSATNWIELNPIAIYQCSLKCSFSSLNLKLLAPYHLSKVCPNRLWNLFQTIKFS